MLQTVGHEVPCPHPLAGAGASRMWVREGKWGLPSLCPHTPQSPALPDFGTVSGSANPYLNILTSRFQPGIVRCANEHHFPMHSSAVNYFSPAFRIPLLITAQFGTSTPRGWAGRADPPASSRGTSRLCPGQGGIGSTETEPQHPARTSISIEHLAPTVNCDFNQAKEKSLGFLKVIKNMELLK